jgi:diguanylate cyclase (GGDEF)-like protein
MASRLSRLILDMLEVHASSELPKWAASRLGEAYAATATRVLHVFPIAAARRPGVLQEQFSVAAVSPGSAASPVPVGEDQALNAAISSRTATAIRRAGALGRLLVPLWGAGEPRYLIDLEGAQLSQGEAAEASEFTAILASYYQRLVDAETDPLTGLSNRRVFYSKVGTSLSEWTGGDGRLFLAMADIDHFKQVNDKFGHLYGDEILIHFARIMQETFRASDQLFRFGGEEFVMVFTVDRPEHGSAPLERFLRSVERYAFPRVGRITASIGYTSIRNARAPATSLIDRADNAVYYAKHNGRNRVCEYEALVAQGALPDGPAAGAGEATLF